MVRRFGNSRPACAVTHRNTPDEIDRRVTTDRDQRESPVGYGASRLTHPTKYEALLDLRDLRVGNEILVERYLLGEVRRRDIGAAGNGIVADGEHALLDFLA
jgi:hypothetical protein